MVLINFTLVPVPDTGMIRWNSDGHMLTSAQVGVNRILQELAFELEIFRAQIDCCEQTENGDYLLHDPLLGSRRGLGVTWQKVILLAGSIITSSLQPLTHEQLDHFKEGGVVFSALKPRWDLTPLVDAMLQIQSAILFQDREFPSILSRSTVARIDMLLVQVRIFGKDTRLADDSPSSRKHATAPQEENDFRPASAFPVGLHGRLRAASLPERKSKRVRSIVTDGVKLYSWSDACLWWRDEMAVTEKLCGDDLR